MIAVVGIALLYGVAFLLSWHRRAIQIRLLASGLVLQLVFALVIMKTLPGRYLFQQLAAIVAKLLDYTAHGSRFVFGTLADPESFTFLFAFQVLPIVIFIASLFSVLYYIGLMQRVVLLMARVMHRLMGVSGGESLAAAANVFMGQTEAPIVVAPYIPRMTTSELMAVMTGGMATVSGAVLATYISLGVRAEYLLAASVMAAPASLALAKMLIPETEQSATAGKLKLEAKTTDVNIIDAAARGAGQGVTLALNIGGMLVAFVALIYLIDGVLGAIGAAFSDIRSQLRLDAVITALTAAYVLLWRPSRTLAMRVLAAATATMAIGWLVFAIRGPSAIPLQMATILGSLFAPVAFLMGVPWEEAGRVGELFGTKLVLNEFVAYRQMTLMLDAGLLSPKAELVASYALCGFANFTSVAIQIGGIGALAPDRRSDLARIGLWSVLGGTLASYSVAALAGIISGL